MSASPCYAAHTSTAMLVLYIDIHNIIIIIILLYRAEEPLYDMLPDSICCTPEVTERPVTTTLPTIVTTEFTEMQKFEYSNVGRLTRQYQN